MPKRKRPEEKPEEQFQRFIETAREVEADETGKALDKAFRKLAPKKSERRKQTD